MLKIFSCTVLLFSALSVYDAVLQNKTITNKYEKQSVSKRNLASYGSVRKDLQESGQILKPASPNQSNKNIDTKKMSFSQWSQSVGDKANLKLQEKRNNLKKLSPSELMLALRKANSLSKPKKMQALRVTARRFIPESLLFYLAGNLVSITDHSAGISNIDNPRFFQTEIDSVLSPEGGAHFFTFIFFNQMYSAWSQKKIRSGTASIKLNKFLKSSANSFAGMAVAGLGASIVFDLGSMIYHCGLNKLQKVEETQESDIFATPKAHFAACDDLYLRFVSGRMEAAWINQLALGLIPAAVLAQGVSKGAKLGFQKIAKIKNSLQLQNLTISSGKKITKAGSLTTVAGKVASGAKAILSASWVGALVNFSLFVGMERLLMSHATEWGSKKINLKFLNSYQKDLKIYLQKGLGLSWKEKELEARNQKQLDKKSRLSQCVSKECVEGYYIEGFASKVLSPKEFLHTLSLYAQTSRERRELLLSKGKMHYQNWISSFKKLSLKYDASFKFYFDFINKIKEGSKMVQEVLMPLAYVLPAKSKMGKLIRPQEFLDDPAQTSIALNIGQRENLKEGLFFLNALLLKIEKSSWFFNKDILFKQLTQLKRQIFSSNVSIQLVGFKNLQILAKQQDKKFTCHSRRTKSINCSVVQLYKKLGQPQSKTYLDNYIQSWASIFSYSYGKSVVSQIFAKNLAEDFLLSMVCGKTEGEIVDIVGWDKNFHPPKIISLNNNSCKFHSIKVPTVHMLCDKDMGEGAYNVALSGKKNTSSSFKNILEKDFNCAKSWGVDSHKMPKYSVMSSYFAVSNKGQVSTYNSLADLVVRNLSKKFLSCSTPSCHEKLALAASEKRDLNIFELWWIDHIDPYVLKQMNKASIATSEILDQEILPVLYQSKNSSEGAGLVFLSDLLSVNVELLSVMQSLENESLVYKKIIEKIYNKHCQSEVCMADWRQWSAEVNFNLKQLMQNQTGLDSAIVEKISKNLKAAYNNLFYTLVPQVNMKIQHYFKNIDQGLFKQSGKVTAFEKEVLVIAFKSLNAQLFELGAYQSLLLERN